MFSSGLPSTTMQVRELARLDGADLVAHAHGFGAELGGRDQGLHGRIAGQLDTWVSSRA